MGRDTSRTGLLDMGGAYVWLRGSSSCVCSTTSSRVGSTSGRLGDDDRADSTSAPDGGLYGGEERGTWITGDNLRLVPRDPELETCMPLSFRFSLSGALFRGLLSGVDSACGIKSSKSKLSVSSSPLWSLSSTSVVCCAMRNKLGCLALRLKFVKASIEASCRGVAPILIADGGRVPWAGDSEPNDDSVRSKPVVSPSGAASSSTSSEGDCAGAFAVVDGVALLLDDLALVEVRVLFDAFDAGVRFLVEGMGTSSAAGSAPVIIRSASSADSMPFLSGRLPGRVAVDFVTSPSLSSLKLVIALLAFAVFVDAAGLGSCVRGAVFATRVVADVILVLFGRGIVAVCIRRDECDCRVVRS